MLILSSVAPYAPKVEDRSEEETLKQERCARRVAWEMVKSIHKPKEKEKATFTSLSEGWCQPAPSSTKLDEREFVVDSVASMHIVSRKDLKSADTGHFSSLQKPYNGSYRQRGSAHERGSNSVRLRPDFFVTVQIFEDTPAVLSLGKHSEDHGYSYFNKNGRRIQCITDNYVPIAAPRLSTGSSSSTTSTSPTPLPQDLTAEESTPSPASTTWKNTQSSFGRPVARLRRYT